MLTDNSDFADICSNFHNQGRARRKSDAAFPYSGTRGSNLRLSEFQGSLLVAQMTRVLEQTNRRTENANYLTKLLNEIPGVSCVEPRGALYCFPRLDPEVYPIKNDEDFVIDLLRAKKILVTHGTGFNWFEPDHFRLVTLPDVDLLTEAIGRIADFLAMKRG